jgi:hypothetical protein
MVDKEIIREWIIKAEDDFHFARISLIEKNLSGQTFAFCFNKAPRNTSKPSSSNKV